MQRPWRLESSHKVMNKVISLNCENGYGRSHHFHFLQLKMILSPSWVLLLIQGSCQQFSQSGQHFLLLEL